jgi:hypothetical protein
MLHDFWVFLRERKKFWLLPMVIVFSMLGGLLILTSGPGLARFVYF